ncbi:MAG: 50S ribosomal protein L6 [Alphaproteobacteria bacterium]
MSRIGKHAIDVPAGVTCELRGREVFVKGKLGELFFQVPSGVEPEFSDGKILFRPMQKTKELISLWGTSRSIVKNIVTGVHEGFSINLEIEGVGYRASVQGKNLKLQLGYSHDVDLPIPEGIQIKCDKPTLVTISGADKQKVGQVAAKIKSYRPPEPFNGKGIRKQGQFILRKQGKKK